VTIALTGVFPGWVGFDEHGGVAEGNTGSARAA